MCLSDCPVKPVGRPRQKPAVCKSRMWSSHGLHKHHALQIGIPEIQVIKTQQITTSNGYLVFKFQGTQSAYQYIDQNAIWKTK